MGKIRIKTLGADEIEAKQKAEAKRRRAIKRQKKAAEEKNAENNEAEKKVAEEVAKESVEPKSEKKEAAKKETIEEKVSPRKIKKIGKKHKKAQKAVDPSKKYSIDEAVKLVKKMSYADFDETIELHLNLHEKNLKGEVTLPHGTGKSLKVAIADAAVLKDIEAGKIDFDILISTPAFMPKIVPLARVLGPKGLMPNPKAGTVSEKPEEAAKKFKGGAIRYKSEIKFPIVHQSVGKASFEDKKLIENISTFVKSVTTRKIESAHLSSTMSPSVQLEIEK